MADVKITALSAFSQADPANDLLVAVDVSDTAMAATGTDKKTTANFLRFAMLSDLVGLGYSYANPTTVGISAGTAGVNGKVVSFAPSSYNIAASGALQAKNIAGANVTTWATNSAYLIFLKDDGTIAFELFNGTGDGAAAVFDATYGYYKAASTGVACRRIGKFWTAAANTIQSFKVSIAGRRRFYWLHDQASKLLVSGVDQPAFTAVPGMGAYLSADDEEIRWLVTATSINGNFSSGVSLSTDGGTSAIYQSTVNTGAALPTGAQFGVDASWLPNTGTAHYSTVASSVGYVGICGVSFSV